MKPISPFVERTQQVHVVIETPAGSRPKYEWDDELEVMKLKRLLPLGMSFPFDFGFIPGTRAADGDPLDVLLISDAALVSGSLVDARVVGAIEIKQESDGQLVRNDRLVAVPALAGRYAGWHDLGDLGEPLIKDIETFLETYVEHGGRRFELLGRAGHRRALKLVRDARCDKAA
jgi:inorganic pyrophosphatase